MVRRAIRSCAWLPADNGFLPWDLDILRQIAVVVRFGCDDWRLVEVVRGRRRWDGPLQAGSIPRVIASARAILQRPGEVEQWQQVADTEDGSSGGGQHIQHLELRRILPIAAI